MAVCPNCNNEMALSGDDFGMIPCSHCGVMVFVDMDGQVQIYDADDSVDDSEFVEPTPVEEPPMSADMAEEPLYQDEPEPVVEESSFEEVGDQAEAYSLDGELPELSSELPEAPAAEDYQADYQMESVSEEPLSDFSEMPEAPALETEEYALSENSGEYALEEPAAEMESYEESNFEESEPIGAYAEMEAEPVEAYEVEDSSGAEPAEEYPAEAIDFDKPLVEEPGQELEEEPEEEPALDPLAAIEDFGNQEVQFEGPLSYDVQIDGIDTAEMRTWVQEALDDARFLWAIEEVMEAITNGQLILYELNPVKASLIVSRLKPLKVKMSWRQSAVQGAD